MPFLRDCLVAHHDGSGPGVIRGFFMAKIPRTPYSKENFRFPKAPGESGRGGKRADYGKSSKRFRFSKATKATLGNPIDTQ